MALKNNIGKKIVILSVSLASLIAGWTGRGLFERIKPHKPQSIYTMEERIEMHNKGTGLPDWYHDEMGRYPGFIHEQRATYKALALHGQYGVVGREYVNPTSALETLKAYGWDHKILKKAYELAKQNQSPTK